MLVPSRILSQLPSLDLAKTSLPQFIVQSLLPWKATELKGLASFYREESPNALPRPLALLLSECCQEIAERDLEPRSLNASQVEHLLASPSLLEALSAHLPPDTTQLFPGMLLDHERALALRPYTTVFPGLGSHWMLLHPVRLLTWPEAFFEVPEGRLILRKASPDEGEQVHQLWSELEVYAHFAWQDRVLHILRKSNFLASKVKKAWAHLEIQDKSRLFQALLMHLRESEWPESHRPLSFGLKARVAALDLALEEAPWLVDLLDIARELYLESKGSPSVLEGFPPVKHEDFQAWLTWVDVPDAQKEALRDLRLEEIEEALVLLQQDGSSQDVGALAQTRKQALQNLRDRCLIPKWKTSSRILEAIDPELLLQNLIESGDDQEAMKEAMRALIEEAKETSFELEEEASDQPKEALFEGDNESVSEGDIFEGESEVLSKEDRVRSLIEEMEESMGLLEGSDSREVNHEDTNALGSSFEGHEKSFPPPPKPPLFLEEASPSAPTNAPSLSPQELGHEKAAEAARGLSLSSPPRALLAENKASRVTSPRFVLPPMPSIPPRTEWSSTKGPKGGMPQKSKPLAPVKAPATFKAPIRTASNRSQTIESLPLPDISELASRMASPMSAPSPTEVPKAISRTESQAQVLPVSPRPHGPRSQHLVTPAQGNAFYDRAFRELERIERDALLKGPSSEDRKAVEHIRQEAHALHDALGPSARSGDKDFQSAQQRLEKVIQYLQRLEPSLNPQPEARTERSFSQRLVGVFRKK